MQRSTALPSRTALALVLAFAATARAGDEPPVQAPAEPPADKPDAKDAEPKSERERAAARADEIVVIGRRLDDGVPVVPLESVGSRDVFGPRRVREIGAREMNDLIVNIPAISTRPYNGGEASAPSFSMRGLPDDGLTEYVHVMIDGVPASPLPYGWTAFSFLPITTERVYAIDLIRGAHAVRYSPNTVGGILNFVTHPIPNEPLLEVRQTFGNFGYSSSLISAGATDGRLGVLATLVERSGDGYRDGGDFHQTDANVKLRWDLSEDTWIAGSISRFEDEHKAPGGLTNAEFDMDRFANSRPRNRFDGDRSVVDVVLHSGTDDYGWIEAFASYSDTFRNLIAQRPHFGRPTSFQDWTDDSIAMSLGVRGQRTFELGGVEHTLFGGLRFHDESIPSWKIKESPFSGGPAHTIQDSDLSLTSWSAHIDDTFEPIERLTVNAGVRFEDVTRAEGKDRYLGVKGHDDFSTALPGIGASYRVADNAAVFANSFKGFRAPQVWGFAEMASGGSLKFEKADSAELGFRFHDVSGFSGTVTRWRNRFDDFGVFYTGFYENLGRIQSEGTDLEVSLDVGQHVESLHGFSVSGALTHQDARIRSGPDDGAKMPYAWDDKASWQFRYETADEWTISLGGTYVGPSFSDEAETRGASADGSIGRNPPRTLWDMRVAKNFPLNDKAAIEVALGATNLFDKEWYVHSRGGFFGGGNVAGAPRQTYLSVALTLNW